MGNVNRGVVPMHRLIKLPYSYDALEPHIDARTMEIHHSKHHASYLDKLNQALSGHPDLEEKSVEELISDLNSVPEDIRRSIRNNGGGDVNHRLFFFSNRPSWRRPPRGHFECCRLDGNRKSVRHLHQRYGDLIPTSKSRSAGCLVDCTL